jgi:truncated hemoglobin YjbI
MTLRGPGRTAAVVLFVTLMAACSSMPSMGTAVSAFDQLGGMSTVNKLASGFVNSSLKDPRLSGLTAGRTVDAAAASTKVSDQLCSILGGGCKAPFTDAQLSSAASKLSPDQAKALSDNFSSTLNSLASNPAVRDAVTKAVGSKLGGLGGLL